MAEAQRSVSSTHEEQSPKLAGSETTQDTSHDHVPKSTHERSPLISPSETDHEEDDDSEVVDFDPTDDREETKSVWYIILTTIGIGGLQLAWAVELSNGSPYLLSLGLSKSLMALVWIAGPLSGTLVQPYVGMLSDNCRSSWGKRTPFMVSGALATIISLLALAWVREIVGGFLGIFGASRDAQGVKTSIIVVAVLFVYILDFAINTVQAGIRAFILDCTPSHQQESANSMASRVIGVGNILGYVAGYINLPKYLWFFGNTQFKVLCVIASLALSATVALSIGTIRERDARLEGPAPKSNVGLLAFFKKVFRSIRRLPPQTRKVCEVQFFAWIGFFPQLFYSSSYIADIFVQPYLEANPNMTPAEIDQLYEKATRRGAFALLIYAITSVTTNIVLPFLIAPSYDTQATPSSSSSFQKSYTTRTTRFFNALVIPWLTLRRAWLCSHLVFATCMFSTLLVRSIGAATAVIGVVGISWALTLWAPFAIISAEISKRDALRRSRKAADLDDAEEAEADQAGVILGIHNMSVAAPQILATIGSSIIFKFLQKPRGKPGDRSIAVVLACGGIFTLFAAFLTSRIKDEVLLEEEQGYTAVEEGNTEGRRSVESAGRTSSAGARRSSGEGAGRPSVDNPRRKSATLIRSSSYSGLGY